METMYNQKEAARILNISVMQLTVLAMNGQINYTIVGKRRRFFNSHIQEYILRESVKADNL